VFERLYHEQWTAVVNYARFRLGAGEAEDVAADAFSRAWQRRDQYQSQQGPLETWLWGIARNAATDRLRRRRSAPAPLERSVMADLDLEADAARRVEIERVTAAMKRLADLDRELIALRFGAGLTNRAIARLVGLSEGNVALRLHRALRRLRVTLERDDQP
jgi:RNA polymerase sigma-70 factor, ECF subfamily